MTKCIILILTFLLAIVTHLAMTMMITIRRETMTAAATHPVIASYYIIMLILVQLKKVNIKTYAECQWKKVQ